MTHHTTTQQEIIDIKCVFQSYYMKKYILIHFEIQKKLIVVGLFLLLAGFRGPQANFTGRSFSRRAVRDEPLHFTNMLNLAVAFDRLIHTSLDQLNQQ